jgi:hypothetical protein
VQSDHTQRDGPSELSAERMPAPPEVTITRRVGRGLALLALIAGQVLSTAWMFAIEFTSGTRFLARAAFVGYLGFSAVAWWIATRRPGWAVMVMAAGCGALFGLLVLADSQGWLGAWGAS